MERKVLNKHDQLKGLLSLKVSTLHPAVPSAFTVNFYA